LLILCLGQLMIILDGTIVNVALPIIQRDLRFSETSLAWVVDAYLIAFGSFLMLAGRLGDRLGRRRVTLAGLALFTLASAACGFAGSAAALVVARFVQGVGGAAASANVLAMLLALFPVGGGRASAMGVYSFVGVAGGSIGLLLGGVLTEALSWHWIFFVNVPIGAFAVLAGRALIVEQRDPDATGGVDIPGAVLMTSALMLGVFTIVKAAGYGWLSPRTLGLAAVTGALGAAFIAVEQHRRDPLIPLGALRSRVLSSGCGVIALLLVAIIGWFYFGSLYLEHVLGYGASKTGAAFMPATLLIGALSLQVTARLTDRFGARPVLVAGLGAIVLGLLAFSRAPAGGSYVADVLPGMLLLGFGAGLTFLPVFTIATSETTGHGSGLASGLVNTAQQVGGALGLSVLAGLASNRTAARLADGVPQAQALVSGYHLAQAVSIGAALAAAAVTFVALRPWLSAPLALAEPVHHGP
jgi:EmrB/QacA subfamily drug resistance transporter